MADFNSPLPAGTPIGTNISGKLHGNNLLNDTTGEDAMGLVTTSPGANTLLGRLKAIVTALAARLLTDAGPASKAFAITPSDGTAISPIPRAVRVNAAGTVAFRASGSSADVTITAVAGEIIPVNIQYIRAAGTSATGFVGYAD
ncbi:hypothetical protein [uncultured Sphingomonas sp.]|uniref:spike base protein, RCAP_Rcc01079 family n=1 Tax=uncultured Sphingomonas sp. TaxID=158754 RepID=UPI0025D6D53E|nr:hypothetical protein [uncultured Sphingomonas sp.]